MNRLLVIRARRARSQTVTAGPLTVSFGVGTGQRNATDLRQKADFIAYAPWPEPAQATADRPYRPALLTPIRRSKAGVLIPVPALAANTNEAVTEPAATPHAGLPNQERTSGIQTSTQDLSPCRMQPQADKTDGYQAERTLPRVRPKLPPHFAAIPPGLRAHGAILTHRTQRFKPLLEHPVLRGRREHHRHRLPSPNWSSPPPLRMWPNTLRTHPPE